jgi:hypothetical protein
VTRSTDGATTTITLTPDDTPGIEFTSTEVDAGHANRYSGWSGQTFTRGGDDDLAMLAVSNDVDTGDVTVGLEITAVTYTIQPGGSMDFGDATFTCDTGGVPCVVTVDDDRRRQLSTRILYRPRRGSVRTEEIQMKTPAGMCQHPPPPHRSSWTQAKVMMTV